MRKYAWLILSMGLTFGLVGCGDDGNTGSGGSPGSGGSGGGTATLSGIVYQADDADGTPFQGAAVSVVGGASTTSGVGGVFSLQAAVGVATLVASADGHWGELGVGEVPAAGLADLEPEVIPDAMVDEIGLALEETIDPAKGIVAVEFENPVAGNSADVGVNYGFAFVFNADDEPVVGTELVANGGNEVIFVNVDVSADSMPTAKNASDADCATDVPTAANPTQAKVITLVTMNCP